MHHIFPDDWGTVARKGVEEAMHNRPKEIGNDEESLKQYRDHMLIEFLKLHHKL